MAADLASGGRVDVVVVGGGLAGLVAANRLTEAGASTVVLEATGEVGGRTLSRMCGGRIVDVGGEWVGRDYVRLRRLVSGLGLHLEPTAPLPRLRLRPAVRPPLEPASLFRLGAAARRLGRLCRSLPAEAPWEGPRARELDALSFADWLDKNQVDDRSARLLGSAARAFTTAPPERLSLLHLLVWMRPAGGLSAVRRETRWRVREGAQEVCKRLAARLGPGRVVLDAPVSGVEQDPREGAAVRSTDGRLWEARRVALCVPLPATLGIAFRPELPDEQLGLLREVPTPPITRLVAAPDSRRRPSLIAVGDPVMPLASRDPHHGVGFAYGQDASLPPERLKARLLEVLELGEGDVEGTVAYPWQDHPYAKGGYVAFAPGQLTHHGPALCAGHGRVYFAGADRSVWPGTMEGAVADGERVAALLLDEPPS